MKNILFFLFLTLILSLLLSTSACEIFRDSGPVGTYITDTLTHSAFDFSEGQIPSDYNLADGETIGWCPEGQHPDYANNDKWIWWRTSDFNSELQKDYGVVDLSSITSAPAIWDNIINPLLEGHCYVISCNDGYAKFKVISSGFHDWDVEVEYEFSSGKDFK